MSNMDSVNIGDQISFDVYPSAIIGQSYKSMKVMAFLDPDTAAAFEDIATLHAQVYPTLPGGTPNDAYQYEYLRLKSQTGSTVIVGLPWIVDSTVVVDGTETYSFKVSNLSPSQKTEIVNILASRGFSATVSKVV